MLHKYMFCRNFPFIQSVRINRVCFSHLRCAFLLKCVLHPLLYIRFLVLKLLDWGKTEKTLIKGSLRLCFFFRFYIISSIYNLLSPTRKDWYSPALVRLSSQWVSVIQGSLDIVSVGQNILTSI